MFDALSTRTWLETLAACTLFVQKDIS
jgi:hypothetical protein